MNYNFYRYDRDRNSAVMTDMNGKELVVDLNRAEAQVVLENPEDEGYW